MIRERDTLDIAPLAVKELSSARGELQYEYGCWKHKLEQATARKKHFEGEVRFSGLACRPVLENGKAVVKFVPVLSSKGEARAFLGNDSERAFISDKSLSFEGLNYLKLGEKDLSEILETVSREEDGLDNLVNAILINSRLSIPLRYITETCYPSLFLLQKGVQPEKSGRAIDRAKMGFFPVELLNEYFYATDGAGLEEIARRRRQLFSLKSLVI